MADPARKPAADAPEIVKRCDDPAWKPDPAGGPKSREECRRMAEGIHCANPLTHTAWCKTQRERRMRDRQILLIGAAVIVALVYLSD
jgi:hypothetical protein